MTRAFRPPRLRTLKTEEAERHATWLGLFYDLVFGFAVAFSLWWVYFENVRGSVVGYHWAAGPVSRAIRSAQVWIYTHLLLVLGLTAASVGVAHAVAGNPGGAPPRADRLPFGLSVALCLACRGVLAGAGHVRLMGAGMAAMLALGGGFMSTIVFTAALAAACVAQVVLGPGRVAPT